MTFVSLVQATHRLGIDLKTLHRWLSQAKFPLQSHPDDGRKKGVSSEHLQELSRLHQRSLAPLPEESAAPEALAPPEQSLALLAMPEQLAALQAQITALQHQVADLIRLIQQPKPDPIVPPTQTQPSSTVKQRAKPTRSASGLRSTAKTPPKSVHVIPHVEYDKQGGYVVICPKKGLLPLEPDTEEWFAWVAKQEAFRFVGKSGSFTAHHEWRVPRGAWRAHRKIRNQSYNVRLAPNHELTIAVLEQAAEALQAHL